MHSPLISIIIPTLNEEKLILRTLSQFNSGRKEKYDFEIIISDGGSTDSTLELVKNKVDLIIKATADKKQNIPVGRNAGAEQAQGKFLYFVNADTSIKDPELFFALTMKAFEDPKILAITCNFRVFPDEEILSDKIFHIFYNRYICLINFLGLGMGRGECQLIRKEIFSKIGGYNELLPAGEDFDLYRRIRKMGKVKFLNKLTVYESPRRYRKYGYSGVFWDWTRNSISVLLKNRSSSKEWKAVR